MPYGLFWIVWGNDKWSGDRTRRWYPSGYWVLGIDWITEHVTSSEFNRSRVKIGGTYRKLTSRSWCRRVIPHQDVTIPQRSESEVDLTRPETVGRRWWWHSLDYRTNLCERRIYVSLTVIPDNRLDGIPVRIINVKPEPIPVRAGASVANLQQAEALGPMPVVEVSSQPADAKGIDNRTRSRSTQTGIRHWWFMLPLIWHGQRCSTSFCAENSSCMALDQRLLGLHRVNRDRQKVNQRHCTVRANTRNPEALDMVGIIRQLIGALGLMDVPENALCRRRRRIWSIPGVYAKLSCSETVGLTMSWLTLDVSLGIFLVFVNLHGSRCYFWLFIQAVQMWYFCYLCISVFGLHFVTPIVAVGTTAWRVVHCVVKLPFLPSKLACTSSVEQKSIFSLKTNCRNASCCVGVRFL